MLNKILWGALVVLSVGKGSTLVASDAGQQRGEEEKPLACCLKMPYEPLASEYGIGIDEPDSHGFTELQHAVVAGKGATINWLLGQGADPTRVNHAGASAITLAAQNIDDGNLYYRKRMLGRMLAYVPDLDTVQDPKRGISPVGTVTFLRNCYPLGVPRANADLLAWCIAQERQKRTKKAFGKRIIS